MWKHEDPHELDFWKWVSEELSSVETIYHEEKPKEKPREFQKNLVVWKPNFRLDLLRRKDEFQKNLVVWKRFLCILHVCFIKRFQKNLVVWKQGT